MQLFALKTDVLLTQLMHSYQQLQGLAEALVSRLVGYMTKDLSTTMIASFIKRNKIAQYCKKHYNCIRKR